MSKKTLLIYFTTIIISFSGRVNSISIYEALSAHGLPTGLLPNGVKHFIIQKDGKFEAHLDNNCRSKLENQFEYKKDISGELSYGRVGNLTGMESLELFVWVKVKEIRVDIPNSGRIHFELEKGVHKELSLSLFETPVDCVPVEFLSGDFVKKEDRALEYRRFSLNTNSKDVM